MPKRQKFNEKHLDEALNEVSENLSHSVEGFLLGGLAMIKHEAKLSTKDVDIVFSEPDTARKFIEAAKKTGFRAMTDLPEEYVSLETMNVLTREDETRFDVFYKKVCGCLEYTQEMRERAKAIQYDENLKIYVSSIEDIFLFKAITDREADLDDMATLALAQIDWNSIEQEARNQKNAWMWIGKLWGRLLDLREKHGVVSPLLTRLKDEWEISQSMAILLGKMEIAPITKEEAKDILKEPEMAFVEKVLEHMIVKNLAVKKESEYHIVTV